LLNGTTPRRFPICDNPEPLSALSIPQQKARKYVKGKSPTADVKGPRTPMDQEALENIVELLLAEARKSGADQAEAGASHNIGLSATARLGEVENLEYTNDRGVGVTIYSGSRKGSANTSDFNPDALREAVAKACSFAKYTAPDKHAGLADGELMASDPPDLDLAHPWELESDQAIRLAIACEDAARSFDKRISNSEGATVATNSGVRAYGNSHGFIGSYRKTSHSISCAVVGEANGHMERDHWYSTARDAADLESPEGVGSTAARRAVERLGARKLKTVKAPVIFAPETARGFVGHAIGAIAGGAQYRRSSFLLDAAGQRIFPDFFRIEERPHLLKGLASAPYDAEGVATKDRDIVVDGILQGYILSSYSARRLGLVTTGNAGGAHNLIMPGNAADMNELLALMGNGLLVYELIGQGVNGVTGDYSRGAVGFWVENGEVAFPVHEVTIAGNLKELYQRIAAVGRDQDLRGGIRCGSLLVEGMTIAGA
jgi:PmbA protein